MSIFNSISQITVGAERTLTTAFALDSFAQQALRPWRPAQWQQAPLTAIIVPDTLQGTQQQQSDSTNTDDVVSNLSLPSAPPYQTSTMYVFDAVLRAEHRRELRRTQHPIQAGVGATTSTVSDHAFEVPARVTLEIGMSDAMSSYADDLWTSASSKSVSAYQVLRDMLQQKKLVTVITRLDTYENMLVESVAPVDSKATRFGLRATVTLTEIFLANIPAVSSGLVPYSDDDTSNPTSARPQTTLETPSGMQQASPVSSTLTQQHTITNALTSLIPGAGVWSSLNVSSLGGLL